MDWSRIKRKPAAATMAAGAYANLDDLIRIQFRIRGFSLLPKQPVSSILSGRYASRLRGRGLNFEELRRYRPGDDVRTIDWKVTARMQSPHVRVYTEEKDRAILLLVDQRSNMFFGSRGRFKSVTAAEIAAIGAWRGVAGGDRVGAVVFNDTDTIVIVPRRSSANIMTILDAVLGMNHQLSAHAVIEPNEQMLDIVLEKAMKLAPHDMLVVVISDFFGVNEKTGRLVAEIAAHNDVLGCLAFDPLRRHPGRQQFIISDGRVQVEADFADTDNGRRIVADYQAEQEQITYFLRKLSAPLLMISNDGDVAGQLRKLLGAAPGSG